MTAVNPLRRPVRAAGAPPSRLLLQIRKTLYAVQRLGAGEGLARPVFRLVKSDGTIYDVSRSPYGNQCDCPDYVFRREWLDPSGCKHIKALVAEGLLEADAHQAERG